MLLPSSVIDQARDLHPSFQERFHPNKVLLRFLSRWQREIVGRLLEVNRSAVRLTQTITFPLTNFDAGEALAAEVQYVHGADVDFANPDDTKELFIVSWERRYDRVPWPAAYIHGDTFFPLGLVRDWQNVTTVTLVYAPVPATLASIATTSVLADQAEAAAVAACAAFMGSRIPRPKGLEEVPLATLVQQRDLAEERFLNLQANRARATSGRVKENW